MMPVELIYTSTKEQYFITLLVHEEATIAEVIRASGVLAQFSTLTLETLVVGIFGKKKILSDKVTAGDRVEIYRPLLNDPKEARRARAK